MRNLLFSFKRISMLLWSIFCLPAVYSSLYAAQISKRDSAILREYQTEIILQYWSGYEGWENLTCAELDSAFYVEDHAQFRNQQVISAPDKSFKIYCLEIESCGAYCNPQYYAWVHYRQLGQEKRAEVHYASITKIYRLEPKRYLVIDESWSRPALVYTASCFSADILVFENDTVIQVGIPYRADTSFHFCQENAVESDKEPWIKYDPGSKTLRYQYGQNYAYSQGIDVDTLREGQMQYRRGKFMPLRESVVVHRLDRKAVD